MRKVIGFILGVAFIVMGLVQLFSGGTPDGYAINPNVPGWMEGADRMTGLFLIVAGVGWFMIGFIKKKAP